MAEQPSINSKQGQIIAVSGAKGGIGKTLLSVNLAVALNKKNMDVCIVDGDLQFGDVSLAMDIQPSFTIKDIVEEIGRGQEISVSGYLSSHISGVKVLASPEKPEYADLITNELLVNILDQLRSQYDYVVIDTCLGFQDETAEIMEIADQILIVTTLEMTSLKNTKLMLETMEQLGMREKAKLAINRYNMESLLKAEEAAEMLGNKNAYYIPNNFKLASQSINIGVPLTVEHSKSDIAKAVFKMAGDLSSSDEKKKTEIKQGSGKKSSIFTKLIPTGN